MHFTRTRRPVVLRTLRSPGNPRRALAQTVAQPRSPECSELVGACTLILAFLVMAMFG